MPEPSPYGVEIIVGERKDDQTLDPEKSYTFKSVVKKSDSSRLVRSLRQYMSWQTRFDPDSVCPTCGQSTFVSNEDIGSLELLAACHACVGELIYANMMRDKDQERK